jgi:hypothetical protein
MSIETEMTTRGLIASGGDTPVETDAKLSEHLAALRSTRKMFVQKLTDLDLQIVEARTKLTRFRFDERKRKKEDKQTEKKRFAKARSQVIIDRLMGKKP